MTDIAGRFRLGPDSGRLVIKTSRAGLAAKAGHDLTIELTRWSAVVEIPGAEAGGPAAASITADLDLSSLAVREGTGGARPLTDADRREINATMQKVLGGGGTATYRSTRTILAGGDAANGAIEGTLTLNGRSQPVRLQVSSPAPGRYQGTATVTQSAFGITPYTAFFGALKLRDEVAVEVQADLGPAG